MVLRVYDERIEATRGQPMVMLWKGHSHNGTLSGMHGGVSWISQGKKSSLLLLLLLSARLQTPTDRAKCHKPEGTSREGNPKKEKINKNEWKKKIRILYNIKYT